jgi:hypothetical protein
MRAQICRRGHFSGIPEVMPASESAITTMQPETNCRQCPDDTAAGSTMLGKMYSQTMCQIIGRLFMHNRMFCAPAKGNEGIFVKTTIILRYAQTWIRACRRFMPQKILTEANDFSQGIGMAESGKAHGAVAGSIWDILMHEELVASYIRTFGEPFGLQCSCHIFGHCTGTRAVKVVGVIYADQEMH